MPTPLRLAMLQRSATVVEYYRIAERLQRRPHHLDGAGVELGPQCLVMPAQGMRPGCRRRYDRCAAQ
jgi:hypothetical protein